MHITEVEAYRREKDEQMRSGDYVANAHNARKEFQGDNMPIRADDESETRMPRRSRQAHKEGKSNYWV
jgi:hypothetical protein